MLGSRYATGQGFTEVVTPPASSAISLATAKAWMKVTTTADDTIIQAIINSVEAYASAYTKRVLQSTVFRTYRDVFGDVSDNSAMYGYPARSIYGVQCDTPITLRKSPLISVSSVQYYFEDSLTPFTDFYIDRKFDFSRIAPTTGNYWPIPDVRMQAIQINFTAGYTTLPADLNMALLDHILSAYENRGDCGCADSVPANAKAVYNSYRIEDFVA